MGIFLTRLQEDFNENMDSYKQQCFEKLKESK